MEKVVKYRRAKAAIQRWLSASDTCAGGLAIASIVRSDIFAHDLIDRYLVTLKTRLSVSENSVERQTLFMKIEIIGSGVPIPKKEREDVLALSDWSILYERKFCTNRNFPSKKY